MSFTAAKAQQKTAASIALRGVLWLVVLALALPPAYVAESILWAEKAYGQTYDAGYKKYQKGDFKGAEKALQDALKTKLKRDEMVKALKLLGMAQFNLSNTTGASASFRKALSLNPGLAINNSEALYPEVIPFFNKVKASQPTASSQTKTAVKSTAAKTGKTAPPAAAVKGATPSAPAAGVNAAGKTKEINRTTLLVKSKNPGAKVWIDGLIKGDVNQVLDMDPGPTIVEIQLKGYITKKISTNIVSKRENAITVDLEKPKPKPKPKPKQPQPQDVAGSDDMVADGAGDAFGDGAALAEANPKAKNKAKLKGKARRNKGRKKADDMFGPDSGADQYADGDGRGGGRNQMAQQGPNPPYQTDGGAGGYPQGGGYPPGGGYPQPMGYGYAPPPMYYAPPPQMYYAPPPAPPPPPVDNYPAGGDPYAAGGSAPGDPGAGAPPGDPADPAGSDALAGDDKPTKCSKGNILISLLPFGAGQFQNCNILFGVVFAGAEAGALYYFITKKQEADAAVVAIKAYQAKYEEAGGHTEEDDAVEKKYVADIATYIEGVQKTSDMALYAFAGLWVIGVAEALIDAPASGSGKAKKKSKKARKYSGFSQLAPLSPEESPHVASAYEPRVEFGPALTPVFDANAQRFTPHAAFELKLDF